MTNKFIRKPHNYLRNWILSLFVTLPGVVYADYSIEASMQFLQPDSEVLSPAKISALKSFAMEVQTDTGLSWKKAIAIIFQESSFETDPNDCLKKKKICKVDLGMGQINWLIWKRQFPELDRLRLIRDFEYNLKYAGLILRDIHKRHGASKNWHLRYHSGTPALAKEYNRALKLHYVKIEAYCQGLDHGLKRQDIRRPSHHHSRRW